MNTSNISNFLDIGNNNKIIYNTNFLDYINNESSVLYFSDNSNFIDKLYQLYISNHIKNLFIISNTYNFKSMKKDIIIRKISKHTLRNITNNLIVIIDTINDYNFAVKVVKNLILINQFSKELDFKIGYNNNDINFTYCFTNNSFPYFKDIIDAIKCINISDIKEKYEYIYDTVCNFLDAQFIKNNFCDFKNDQCIANRLGQTSHSSMGCCYSFKYASFFDFRLIKDIKLCSYINCKSCSTKCITCKLYTCKYLQKQNIKFDTHKILLLECFFNKKQHLILSSNFFTSKEEILYKLLENNNDFYFWYYIMRKFYINK